MNEKLNLSNDAENCQTLCGYCDFIGDKNKND